MKKELELLLRRLRRQVENVGEPLQPRDVEQLLEYVEKMPSRGVQRTDVRADGLDELVGFGSVHLERMNEEGVYLGIEDWQVWLTSESPIRMTFGDESESVRDPLQATSEYELPPPLSAWMKESAGKGDEIEVVLYGNARGTLYRYVVLWYRPWGERRERFPAGFVVRDFQGGDGEFEMFLAEGVRKARTLEPSLSPPSKEVESAVVQMLQAMAGDVSEEEFARLPARLTGALSMDAPRTVAASSGEDALDRLRRLYLG